MSRWSSQVVVSIPSGAWLCCGERHIELLKLASVSTLPTCSCVLGCPVGFFTHSRVQNDGIAVKGGSSPRKGSLPAVGPKQDPSHRTPTTRQLSGTASTEPRQGPCPKWVSPASCRHVQLVVPVVVMPPAACSFSINSSSGFLFGKRSKAAFLSLLPTSFSTASQRDTQKLSSQLSRQACVFFPAGSSTSSFATSSIHLPKLSGIHTTALALAAMMLRALVPARLTILSLFSLICLSSGEGGDACSFCVDPSEPVVWPSRSPRPFPAPRKPIGSQNNCMYKLAFLTLGRPHTLPPLPQDVLTVADVRASYGAPIHFYDIVAALASVKKPPTCSLLIFSRDSLNNHIFYPGLDEDERVRMRMFLYPFSPVLVTMPVHQFFDDPGFENVRFAAFIMDSWRESIRGS